MAKKETIAQRVARLAKGARKPAPQTEKVKKSTYEKKGGNGGARPGAGRKTSEENLVARGIKKWVDEHAVEKMAVQIKDPQTGKVRTIKKTRLMIALEKLYRIGVEGEGNAEAIDKWLNRILGKAVQPLGGNGDDDPIVLRLDF